MLIAKRALLLSAKSAPELPRIPELAPLYSYGLRARFGQAIMIVGRSGMGKSTFALWLAYKWGLSTLYFSADMNAFTASGKLASMATGMTLEEVERCAQDEEGFGMSDTVAAVSETNITFCFDSPITQYSIIEELNAYVELHDSFPSVIVIDNLMDLAGAESDYSAQMEAVQYLLGLCRETGSTLIILHHATDKSQEARGEPHIPPGRADVKNGLSEKPELAISVALDPHSNRFNVALIKQRLGRQDASGRSYVSLQADPEHNTYQPLTI